MIPDYQTLMEPVLECAKGGEISVRNAVEILADKFQLTQEEKIELLPSGKQPIFSPIFNETKFYLAITGLYR